MQNNIPSRYLVLSLLMALIGFMSSDSLHAQPFPAKYKYAGDYSPVLTYRKGDIVKYGNKSYIALSAVAAYASPASSSRSWTLFLELSTTQSGDTATTFTLDCVTTTFTLDFVTIDNPGNSNDTTGYGGVPYVYQMGTYDITQNLIDAAANAGLPGMPEGDWKGDQPATSLSWYQAAAFVNWLNTNQGYDPAYNLSYDPSNGYSMDLWPTNQAWTEGGTNLYRSANCCYFLPSENEWYKAAYYDPTKNRGKGGYWLYPTGSDRAPAAVASGTLPRTAVYSRTFYVPASVYPAVGLFSYGSPASVYQAGGLSPYGTMGQGGNVFQWMESAYSGSNSDPAGKRSFFGGWWSTDVVLMRSSSFHTEGSNTHPDAQSSAIGFRVARILP
jgi:formylglycine-generating enzyme required for sulfatase activity